MARSLRRVINRIHGLAAAGHVIFTAKAQQELDDLDFDFDLDDAAEVVSELTSDDFYSRIRSTFQNEWMYVFKPEVFDVILYVKLVIRDRCIVVSFHNDADE